MGMEFSKLSRLLGTACAALLALGLMTLPVAAQPIKVGAINPLSGGIGPDGQHVVGAVKVMADLINSKGGLLGRQIEVIEKDDESTPAVGVARANELIGAGVSVIFEGYNSPVTLAMQPVIARANVLDITMVSKADQIISGSGNPYAIRLNSSNALDSGIIAEIAVKRLGGKRIAFMTENDAYGNGAQTVIEAAIEKLGGAQVVHVEKFPLTQTDFRVALANVKNANPDVVITIDASSAAGMPALLQQFSQAHISAKLVGATGTLAATTIKVAGEAATGAYSADIYFPYVEPFASIPENQQFVQLYKAKFGVPPDKLPALGAMAVQIWAQAVERVQSLDRVKVAKAIRGGTFDHTIFGKVSFQDDGQMRSNYSVYIVRDGQMAVME